ncbi:FG-GAP repeat domain-containing protein [Nannocystis radixulma]|uniref:VCBS repeat-containing protein n=1 Tax=Nannocystis radixulma TaxID=2995305 RepID=A0ABT5BMA0_9BACT|nr:VCBS repeat-containing protein [Nannocystis radixulma]MDC0674793.1 VCBS repeat-containing protein [Nannocystis radixulma]
MRRGAQFSVVLAAGLVACGRPQAATRTPEPVTAAAQPSSSPTSRKFSRCLPPDRSFAVGERPVDLALLRLPGAPALVVANAGSSDLSLVRRDGERWREVQRVKTAPEPFALATADIDADGLPDVVAIHRERAVASVHLARADGTLGPARALELPAPAQALAAADLDGDGDVELAFGSGEKGEAGRLRVLSLGGDGRPRDEAGLLVSELPVAVAAGDIRGDSGQELAVFHHGSMVQSIVSPGRPRRDDPYREGCCVALNAAAGVLVDLLGDRHLEAVGVSLDGWAGDPGRMAVYGDDGFERFIARTVTEVAPAPHQVLARDVDGDGRPELLVFAGVRAALERFPWLKPPPIELMPLDPSQDADAPVLQIYALDQAKPRLRAEVPIDGVSFVVEDLTGDGALDVAAVQGRLHVHPGLFSSPAPGPRLADGLRSLFAFDVDRDGDAEVVVERAEGCSRLVAQGGAYQLRTLGRDEVAPRAACGRKRGREASGLQGPELVAPPEVALPPRFRDALATTFVLGTVRRASGGPDDGLLGLREGNRGVDESGVDIVVDTPELVLYLVRAGQEPIRVGSLSDEPGEYAASRTKGSGRAARSLPHSSDVAAVQLGDLDGDGDIELVVVDRRRRLHVAWGRGDGEFAAFDRWSVGPVVAMVVRDLDGDDGDELVTLSDRAAVVQIYAPAGPQAPAPVAVYGAGTGTNRLAVADADDDRALDIVLGDRFTRELEVLRLTPCG